jgi:hypothetical protein
LRLTGGTDILTECAYKARYSIGHHKQEAEMGCVEKRVQFVQLLCPAFETEPAGQSGQLEAPMSTPEYVPTAHAPHDVVKFVAI